MRNIRAKTIVEMLGVPKEHVEATLRGYIKKLRNNGLQIISEDFAEATEQGKLFSAFAELEVRFNSLTQLLDFCFDAMPSSVEILEPDELAVPSREFTSFINDLQARLHEADMLIKGMTAQKKILDTNAINVFNNFILHLLKQGSKRIDELSEPVGISKEELKPFLQKLLEQNIITEKEGVYEIR